ncbi:MAG: UPF0280 family protein [Alphaproteobacteria bacterium]|jgi:hypothetical protein|nr:UPF0280 family protein [Alphaproteobacteria bacterium]MDP6563449.1 UPF0280 family protein [Alphaproteobacteria bacterium]MDP6814508.1 UPF0280 family protein [Alphaproteobacteria bacterium]
MERAKAAYLPDGRLRLWHGPIDLIIEMFGAAGEIEGAYRQAERRFMGLLEELVAELPMLRWPIGDAYPMPRISLTKAMARAVWPFRQRHITPMAAVAGAVADEVLAAAVAGRELQRGYVNNGGDAAFFLAPGESIDAGLVTNIAQPGLDARVCLEHRLPVRGIATSGWRGRSHSLGIADAVTVLATTAAAADAAATVVANQVSVDHPAIERVKASELDPDSDLGDLPVTVAVGELPEPTRRAALLAGVNEARAMQAGGLIHGALLAVGDQVATVGELADGALENVTE